MSSIIHNKKSSQPTTLYIYSALFNIVFISSKLNPFSWISSSNSESLCWWICALSSVRVAFVASISAVTFANCSSNVRFLFTSCYNDWTPIFYMKIIILDKKYCNIYYTQFVTIDKMFCLLIKNTTWYNSTKHTTAVWPHCSPLSRQVLGTFL